MSTNNELLAELNKFRSLYHSLPPVADWRKARHMPMLEKYRAEHAANEANAKAEAEARAAADTELAKKLPVKKAKKAATGEKVVPYKLMTYHPTSLIQSPVAEVHKFLDANPTLGRKASVAKLVEMGINFATARTQYQRWSSKRAK